jgi:hypothetical protein
MVEDLLQGFISQKWVKELDFNTLEKAGGSYVSDNLRDREDDIIWKVRWHHLNEWLYIYLLTDVTHTASFSLKRNDAGASWMGSHAGAWEPETKFVFEQDLTD